MKSNVCFLLFCATLCVKAVSGSLDEAAPATPQLQEPIFTSCKNEPSKVSGVYLIRINNDTSSLEAFCEQEKFDGGWLVVQHRFDGSVDFYRNWTEYREGFGDVDKEFWLGLEKIHQITTARPHEITIEMKAFDETYRYARYDEFKIGSESEHYILTLGKYSGTAFDSMTRNNGMKFATMDRDDMDKENVPLGCVRAFRDPWWHADCTYANLNGLYKNANDIRTMFWYDFKRYQGLSFTRMMIREI
ncbi:angiopoietin-related protein 1-like [Anopheles aquasalis]|uniref:angiopoietin-related protein 1-like n=1 Tax=Anopheles aquasalis TaxID=42839 RepID=UPI00215B6F8A|nr:angiopoietin-related protein 1-like [Anopheles aquasalis]